MTNNIHDLEAEHASRQATGAQTLGILLLAGGIGWAFGWWWSLVVVGVGLVLLGVSMELR